MCQLQVCHLPSSNSVFIKFYIGLVLAKVCQLQIFSIAYLLVCQLPIFLAAYLGVPGEGEPADGKKRVGDFTFFGSKSSLLKPTHGENGILGIKAGAY